MELTERMVKDLAGAIGLTIAGVVAIMYGQSELAGVCFGALATWILKNGYNSVKGK